MRVAAIQFCAGLRKQDNVTRALAMVEEAAQKGAELVVLPEMFALYGNLSLAAAEAEPIPGDLSSQLCELAKRHRILFSAGSFAEQSSQTGLAYNTNLLISPQGEVLASYRKMHRFDVEIPGQVSAKESAHFLAGDECLPITWASRRFGTAICYDLRFPELFRKLSMQGLDVLLLPSAFTKTTGRDHWHILVRARAIENQVFVIAANQVGEHAPSVSSFGHSLIVDPWGKILAEAGGESEEILLADLDFPQQIAIRERVPALKHRRITE